MAARDALSRAQFYDTEPSHLNWQHIADADSMDYGGKMAEFPKHAKRAWKRGDVSDTRDADYHDYGGPEGWASRVGGYREDNKYDEHAMPITVSHTGDGKLSVGDGHHRAYDAVKRKVKQIPVEWS